MSVSYRRGITKKKMRRKIARMGFMKPLASLAERWFIRMNVKKVLAATAACIMAISLTACTNGKEEKNANIQEAANVNAEGIAAEENVKAEDSEEEEVATAIGEFQYACQTSDVDAMLDCLDPGFSQSLKSGRLLLNWMSTQENADEVIMSSMLIAVMNIADISVDLSTMEIEVEEIDLKEDMATVNGTLNLESTTGTYHDDVTMRMAKNDDKWYITGVNN